MVDLELATTEQILEELAKRPMGFVFVSMFDRGNDRISGYLAHSPNLPEDDALMLLHRAEEFFARPLEEGQSDEDF